MWFYRFTTSGTGEHCTNLDAYEATENPFVPDLRTRIKDVLAACLVEQRGLCIMY